LSADVPEGLEARHRCSAFSATARVVKLPQSLRRLLVVLAAVFPGGNALNCGD
jgi:hypothetical protein